jgi:hypothetical protein
MIDNEQNVNKFCTQRVLHRVTESTKKYRYSCFVELKKCVLQKMYLTTPPISCLEQVKKLPLDTGIGTACLCTAL